MAPFHPTRRDALKSGALFAWGGLPALARAEGRDPRLLVIILRGALDGLAAVAPVGDPGWVKLRGEKALVPGGKIAPLPLDGFFALNPAMPNLHRLYGAKQAAFIHAASTSYRERSHFDGQDILESGMEKPGFTDSGWLNRALARLKADGGVKGEGRAFAVGPLTPLVARGPAPVFSWQPQRLAPASADTTQRLLDLYGKTDPALAAALEGRLRLLALGKDGAEGERAGPAPGAARAAFAEAAGAAARYLSRPDGPRVGAMAFNGWDTHINEGIASGALANLLGALDGAIAAIETGLGPAWSETIVVLATEFGRTARINGAEGTDHGTGTVALLAGGALNGGRVIADWPGLGDANLHENRDLRATTDIRAALKGVLRDHLRVDGKHLASDVFPGSGKVAPMAGLTRAA